MKVTYMSNRRRLIPHPELNDAAADRPTVTITVDGRPLQPRDGRRVAPNSMRMIIRGARTPSTDLSKKFQQKLDVKLSGSANLFERNRL